MTEFVLSSDIAEIGTRLGKHAHDFSGKTVLLAGGRGFLGRYFMEVFAYLNEHVLEKPCSLIVLDNLITAGKSGAEIPDFPHVRFVNHDIIQPFDPEERVHYIIQAAGIASPYYYRAYPLETLEVAVQGTLNLLQLAKTNGARLTFFSSSEIYGDPDAKHIPTPESYRGSVSCQGPRACYDESKRVGETLCYIFRESHGTHTNSIRPFNVFGPGMQEMDYRVLPNFASRIKGNRPLNVYGTGNQTRTYCYITDAMVGFLLVILKGVAGEPYNIGNPKPEITVVELVQRIEKALGKKIAYNIIEYPDSYPTDEPNRRCPDIRKARLQLDYQPIVDLNEGLKRFFAWTDQIYVGEE